MVIESSRYSSLSVPRLPQTDGWACGARSRVFYTKSQSPHAVIHFQVLDVRGRENIFLGNAVFNSRIREAETIIPN
jgi:hypothetical protein